MNASRAGWLLAAALAAAGCGGGGDAAQEHAPANSVLFVPVADVAVVRSLRLESGVSFTGI